MPLSGELLNCDCGTGEGIITPGSAVACVGVCEAFGDSVGSPLGVANWNSGVAVGPGVAVLDPSNMSGVAAVGPGRGGFCQI